MAWALSKDEIAEANERFRRMDDHGEGCDCALKREKVIDDQLNGLREAFELLLHCAMNGEAGLANRAVRTLDDWAGKMKGSIDALHWKAHTKAAADKSKAAEEARAAETARWMREAEGK